LARAALNPGLLTVASWEMWCRLVTDKSNRHSGVCIDTPARGRGFAPNHSAIAAMVTAGECRIAEDRDGVAQNDGVLRVLSPCGRCREFIRQIDPANIDTEVVLGRDRSVKLRELLPFEE